MTLVQLYAEHCKTACEWCQKGVRSHQFDDGTAEHKEPGIAQWHTCITLSFASWCQQHVDALTQELSDTEIARAGVRRDWERDYARMNALSRQVGELRAAFMVIAGRICGSDCKARYMDVDHKDPQTANNPRPWVRCPKCIAVDVLASTEPAPKAAQ